MKLILDYAIAKQKKIQRKYVVKLDPKKGNCLVAGNQLKKNLIMIQACDLKEGEIIYQLEECPHRYYSHFLVKFVGLFQDHELNLNGMRVTKDFSLTFVGQ